MGGLFYARNSELTEGGNSPLTGSVLRLSENLFYLCDLVLPNQTGWTILLSVERDTNQTQREER